MKEALQVRVDSWASALTGLGNALRDKLESFTFNPRGDLGAPVLEALYSSNDVLARIAEKLPTEATRAGYTLTVPTEDGGDEEESLALVSGVKDALAALDADAKLREAWIWGRVYGLGAVLLLVDDGRELHEPLDMNAVRSILGLTVLERRELYCRAYVDDVTSPEFGKPALYELQRVTGTGAVAQTGVKVHASRLLTFEGASPSKQERIRRNGAGLSSIERAYNAVRSFDIAWQATGHLITDASQGVFKLDGLMDMLAAGNEALIRSRMEAIDMGRSVARALVVDAERESFERAPHGLQGLDLILAQFSLRVAAAAEMPVSLLMGQAASGLNATGEGDRRFWYDLVAGAQEVTLRPQLEKLVRLVMLAKDGPTGGVEPEGWELKFNPLEQLTDLQQAELRLKQSQVDATYMDRGVLDPNEVAANRFRVSGWSAETVIDSGSRDEDDAPTEGTAPTVEPTTEPLSNAALNGAQIEGAKSIVVDVASGAIPRESGVELLVLGFALEREQAERILGPAGKGFTPATPEPTPGA